MNNGDILERYINKVNRDQSDLRNDIRVSKRHTQENLSKIEERMDTRLNRIEDMMFKQNDVIYKLKYDLIEKMDASQKWIIGIAIATILGITAMVIAVLVS